MRPEKTCWFRKKFVFYFALGLVCVQHCGFQGLCRIFQRIAQAVAFYSKQSQHHDVSNQKKNKRQISFHIPDVGGKSTSLSNKHSVWRCKEQSRVLSDVLACHKSTVKCSVWSPRSSCWNAFVDHTVSCFISQCVSTEPRAWWGWRMTSHCQASGLLLCRSKLSKRTTDILASSVGGGLFGMAEAWKVSVTE